MTYRVCRMGCKRRLNGLAYCTNREDLESGKRAKGIYFSHTTERKPAHSFFLLDFAMSLKWGIIGTGSIAHTFAVGLSKAKKGELVAVGSRAKDTAEKFGSKYGVPADKCYPTYADLLNDPSVDIVYISTPHPQHCEVAIQSVQAKKHVLVEKPFAMNEAEATRVLAAAKENDVFLMEAYMYRCHPQTRKVVELIEKGAIGDVKVIRANFAYNGYDFGPESRLWRNELGGGAILDIGGCMSGFQGYRQRIDRLIRSHVVLAADRWRGLENGLQKPNSG